uniref:PWWP domain-containing protein n=1 Tax=Kryptolebias marmoratus TaxID=37003 RepID=A0A3Q3BCT3_KRYMA
MSAVMYPKGELVWGQIEGFSPWPGIIVPYKRGLRLPEKRMVEWYGQRMFVFEDQFALAAIM